MTARCLQPSFRHPLLETVWKDLQSHPTHLLLCYVAHLSLHLILFTSSANTCPDVFSMLMTFAFLQVSVQDKTLFCPCVISCQEFSHQLKLSMRKKRSEFIKQQIACHSNLCLQLHLPYGSFQLLIARPDLKAFWLTLSFCFIRAVPQSHLEILGCAEIRLHRPPVWDLDKSF